MKLIDLLVKELPKRGGWPEGVADYKYYAGSAIAFDEYDREVRGFRLDIKISEKTASKVTREQYESALAASEGWIEWGGGERPVETGVLVDFKFRNGVVVIGHNASDYHWNHKNWSADIIAYRLYKPDINSRAKNDRLEQDLNECIGQDVDMPEWNGEGLPPIGCACEMQASKGTWIPVEIIAKNDGFTFGWSYDYRIVFLGDKADEFRPLRTEGERAREDAETAIRTCLAGTGAGITPMAAKGIYEAIAAGKIPGVKLEVK